MYSHEQLSYRLILIAPLREKATQRQGLPTDYFSPLFPFIESLQSCFSSARTFNVIYLIHLNLSAFKTRLCFTGFAIRS